MRELVERILKIGVDKVRFEVPCLPLHVVPGLGVSFTSSNDKEVQCFCTISEERYPLKDNFKITLVPQNSNYAVRHYYLSDLESLMKCRNGIPRNFILHENYEDKVIRIEKDGIIATLLNNDNGPPHSVGDEPAIIKKASFFEKMLAKRNTMFWYYMGKLHRENGPAYIGPEGKLWYNQGNLHRMDGPAVIHSSGEVEYWHNGQRIS